MVILIALAAIYGAACVGLFAFQRSLLFVADRTTRTPAELGLPETEVHRLTTSDGVKIDAWLTGSGDRLAIYFHGNGGSLAWRDDTVRTLRGLGLAVLSVEYRGYGPSEGAPSEAGFRLDADAAYDFARQRGYRPSQIVLYGESLGSGVAVSLAARRDVGGVILDAPFSSIADVAADRYWMFPVRRGLRDPFRSDLSIARITVPVLMIHGTDDEVVPMRFGRRLFSLAGPNATFVEVAGAGHVVIGEEQGREAVRAWLKQH